MRKNNSVDLWCIVCHFFYVSTFTLGGGYSMLLVFEDFYVNKKEIFSKEEWEDLVLIAQAAPGAFAINLSYLIGFYTYGLLGAVLAILAVVLPAFLSIVIIGSFLMQYMQTSFMRSFLVGVTCGPIAYFGLAFWQLAKKALIVPWILGSFLFFVVGQLVFSFPLWILLSFAMLLIATKIVCVSFDNKRKTLSYDKKRSH